MNCLYCKAEMERRMSTHTVDRKGYHLFIKEVPAYVCTQCGEKYFEEGEVAAIQKLIQAIEAGIEEVRTAGEGSAGAPDDRPVSKRTSSQITSTSHELPSG